MTISIAELMKYKTVILLIALGMPVAILAQGESPAGTVEVYSEIPILKFEASPREVQNVEFNAGTYLVHLGAETKYLLIKAPGYDLHVNDLSHDPSGSRKITVGATLSQHTLEPDKGVKLLTLGNLRSVIVALDEGENNTRQSPNTITGTLVVHSDPMGAIVFLDGIEMGNSPLRISNIVVGEHFIRMEKPGHKSFNQAVHVGVNNVPIIDGDLEPDSAQRVTEHGYARLTLRSNPPGASVFIDNKSIGVTPCSVDSLESGNHELRLEKKGFKSVSQTIMIEANQETVLSLPLRN